MGSRFLVSLAAISFLALNAISAVEAHGLQGLTLPEAEKDEFFQWFHFKFKEKKEVPNNRTFSVYSTGVNSYVVNLGVETDKDGRIKKVSLFVPRKFIEDPKDAPFARDITKSFLNSALPDADVGKEETLIAEIERGRDKLVEVKSTNLVMDGKSLEKGSVLKTKSGTVKVGDTAWVGNAGEKETPLPKEESAGYKVFLGQADDFSQTLGFTQIDLSNKKLPENLTVIVEATK